LARALGIRAAALLGLLGLLALVTPACTSKRSDPPPAPDESGLPCVPDSSQGPESALVGALQTDLTDTLCPRRDRDYWRFALAGGQIVALDMTYDKLAALQLSAEWFGPQGACVPGSPTSCTSAADCASGELCDPARGGCRKARVGELCTLDAHCPVGERCAIAATRLSYAAESGGAAATHRLHALFPAVLEGDFLLVVGDKLDLVADPDVPYHLRLEAQSNPDTHEPNDAVNMASVITSGGVVSAYLADRGEGDSAATGPASDVDWYVITPSAGSQPIILIDLVWPATASIAPTYSVQQGDWSMASQKARTVGSGTTATYERRGSFVAHGDVPILVRVSNTEPSADATHAYTLSVTLASEPSEAGGRNDSPSAAIVASLGAASASNPPAFDYHGTIGAADDQDWVRIDTPAAVDNTLLYLRATTDAPTDAYLLELVTYRPTGQACVADTDCGSSGRCVTTLCVAPWVQRPSPDGPGDPQLGGLAPNHLETQLPLFAQGQGALYVMVHGLSATLLDLPGYSLSAPYTLHLEHRLEPDLVDRGLTPDNIFFVRPLDPKLTVASFKKQPRVIGAGDYVKTDGTGGHAFVDLGAGTYALAGVGTCSLLTLRGFDASGAPVAGTTVDLTPSAGQVGADCATLQGLGAPLTVALAATTATFAYQGPATPLQSGSLGASVGGVGYALALSTLGQADGALAFTSNTNGLVPRALVQGTTSPTVRITLPADVAAPRRLSLVATNATVACVNSSLGVCQNLVGPPSGVSVPCVPVLAGAAARSACQVQIVSGRAYDVQLRAQGVGLVTLRVDDDTGVLASATYVGSAATPMTLSTGWIAGYISYDGDQDFFTLPLDGVLANFPKGVLSVSLRMAASPVDIRMAVTRGLPGGYLTVDGSARADQCQSGSCSVGVCDPRGQCRQGAYAAVAGFSAPSATCLYLYDLAGSLDVWVNDINSNDWDLANPYEFRIETSEGCPAPCDALSCAY